MIGLFRPGTRGAATEPRIEGTKVFLRPPEAGDYQTWAELREASRDFLAPWEPAWPEDGLTRGAFRHRLRRYALDRRAKSGHSLFIFRGTDDALVGGINVTNIRRAAAQTASLGYWIGAPHAHRGYMTEALELVVGFAFDPLHLNRLEAACMGDNEASTKLLARAGFRHEGTARKYLRINNVWHDHELFALLREDRSG